MENVILDNWSIMRLIHSWQSRSSIPQEFHDFISAIVLWDNVLYPENDYTDWEKSDNPFIVGLTAVAVNDRNNRSQAIQIMNQIYHKEKDESIQTDFQWIKKMVLGDEYNKIELSALNYLLICQEMKCDYLPCSERKEFINTLQTNDYFNLVFNRLMIIAQFEKEYIEYYNETYRYLINNKVAIYYPLLTDYIIDNMEPGMTLIESACHIKEQGLFVHFREYLSKIDGAITRHDWNLLHRLVEELNGETEEIYRRTSSRIVPIEATLLPNPSLTISKDLRIARDGGGLSLLRSMGNFSKRKPIKRYTDEQYWEFLSKPAQTVP